MVMPKLEKGDVVVTSGSRSWQSRVIMWCSNSPWTHVFLVGDDDTLLESYFPVGVVSGSVTERFAELSRDGQTYRVLRVPDLTASQADDAVLEAENMIGRKYDTLQAIIYGLFHTFIDDGALRVICSRYITAAFEAADLDLFPSTTLDVRFGRSSRRYQELRNGWCTPEDLLDFSILDEIRAP